MKYLGLFVCLLAINMVYGRNMTLKIVNGKELDELLKQNPNAVKLTKASDQRKGNLRHAQQRPIIYTLGTGRVQGDLLVSAEFSANEYSDPTHVSAKLCYPVNGPGGIVTYVKINVYQSSDEGRAYVTSGGIGTNNIVVVIEAENTNYFDIYTQIYAK